MRANNRHNFSARPITIEKDFLKHPAGSVLISYGETKVICAVNIEDKVPPFLKNSGNGWLTAEYGLLPAATNTRVRREASAGKLSGRTCEIQRLIGRALRAVVDLSAIGERTITIDCDVIQADGGTRTAAITGSMVALSNAINTLLKNRELKENPIKETLAAVSVGICNGKVICDLDYEEDSSAEVDMNVVMTESGQFVEIQGTAEHEPFSSENLEEMLRAAKESISEIISQIKNYLKND
ncbi:ribonuclease PH [Candidatus Margulisiibacteriota bacterium]